MFMMTAKVDKKHISMVLAGIAAMIALICFFTGKGDKEAPGAPGPDTNEGRIQYLTECGWQVSPAPVQTQSVKIPEQTTDVLERYNALQKSQGFDLTRYAGKTVTRYVYEVKNYPNATEPVYATLLIWKGEVIGGDITDTASNGAIRGLRQTL